MTTERTPDEWKELERSSATFVKRMRFAIGFICGVLGAVFTFTTSYKLRTTSFGRWELMLEYWYFSIPILFIIGIVVGIMFNTVWKYK